MEDNVLMTAALVPE